MPVIQESKKFLLEQFKDKQKINDFLQCCIAEQDNIYNVQLQLQYNRNLKNAVGKQLDKLGTIINLKRNYLDDANYRSALYAQILINNGNGTPEDIIAIVEKVYNTKKIVLREQEKPAHFTLEINGNRINGIHKLLNSIKPAGVSYKIIFKLQNPLVETIYYNFALSTLGEADYYVNIDDDLLNVDDDDNNLIVRTGIVSDQSIGKFNLQISKKIDHVINEDQDLYMVDADNQQIFGSNVGPNDFEIVGVFDKANNTYTKIKLLTEIL